MLADTLVGLVVYQGSYEGPKEGNGILSDYTRTQVGGAEGERQRLADIQRLGPWWND